MVVSKLAEPHAPRIPTLDGWRAIAIVLVLLGHGSDEIARAAAFFGVEWVIPHDIGLIGVQIFFALSGYLITTNMLEEEAWRHSVSLRSFYLRRVFRILPASCTFLLVVGLLSLAGVINVDPSRWLATLLLLSNYTTAPGSWYLGHFWSLAIEEHFYLVWPFAFVMLAGAGRRLKAVAAAVIVVWIWRAIAFRYQLTWTSYGVFWGRTDLQADAILCGVAVALARRFPGARAMMDRWLANPAAIIVLVIAVALLDTWARFGWKSLLAAVSLRSVVLPFLILTTVLRPDGFPARLLELAPMRWLGKVSYSLYLWQQLFLVWDASAARELAFVQWFPVSLVAALGCAWASYRFIERPMIAWGRHWRQDVSLPAGDPRTP